MSELTVGIVNETLSDGSRVFDVTLKRGEEVFTIHAVTELDSHELADSIIEAIQKHSVEKVWY